MTLSSSWQLCTTLRVDRTIACASDSTLAARELSAKENERLATRSRTSSTTSMKLVKFRGRTSTFTMPPRSLLGAGEGPAPLLSCCTTRRGDLGIRDTPAGDIRCRMGSTTAGEDSASVVAVDTLPVGVAGAAVAGAGAVCEHCEDAGERGCDCGASGPSLLLACGPSRSPRGSRRFIHPLDLPA